MKVLLAPPMSAASGTLRPGYVSPDDWITYMYSNEYNQCARSWRSPANPKTAAQTAVRAKVKVLALEYHALTIVQADAWNAFALTTPVEKGRLGQNIKLSGINCYIRVNLYKWSVGGASQVAPPTDCVVDPPLTALTLVGITKDVGITEDVIVEVDAGVVMISESGFISGRITKALTSEAIRPSIRDARLMNTGAGQQIAYSFGSCSFAFADVSSYFDLVVDDVVSVQLIIVNQYYWPTYAAVMSGPVTITAV